MANLKYLKSHEQTLTEYFFTPKRNVWNFRLVHNNTIEAQLFDSNTDEDRENRYYAIAGYAIVGYSRVSYGNPDEYALVDYAYIGDSLLGQ